MLTALLKLAGRERRSLTGHPRWRVPRPLLKDVEMQPRSSSAPRKCPLRTFPDLPPSLTLPRWWGWLPPAAYALQTRRLQMWVRFPANGSLAVTSLGVVSAQPVLTYSLPLEWLWLSVTLSGFGVTMLVSSFMVWMWCLAQPRLTRRC